MCGFQATPTDRQRMKYLIQQLAAVTAKNPAAATQEPAAAYYTKGTHDDNNPTSSPSLVGKWTLLYTDAPDILTLADSDTLA
eukprot:scaffold1344_cov124-Amphora_coffeaeformis.AAC.1